MCSIAKYHANQNPTYSCAVTSHLYGKDGGLERCDVSEVLHLQQRVDVVERRLQRRHVAVGGGELL